MDVCIISKNHTWNQTTIFENIHEYLTNNLSIDSECYQNNCSWKEEGRVDSYIVCQLATTKTVMDEKEMVVDESEQQ